MTKRLIWIDQLKGIAILLVIIGHLIIDSKIENGGEDPVKWFIYTFHMPLFFFLSGIVLSKSLTPEKLVTKLLAFLCPFFVVGTCYIYSIGRSFYSFIGDKDKFGYWYLFVLAIFYVLYYLMTIPKKFGRDKWWIELCIAIGFFGILWYTTKLPSDIGGLLSSLQMYFNWPFFVSGYFLNKYIGVVKGRRWICPLSLVSYIAFAFIFSKTQFLGTLTYYLRGMGMIIFLVALLYENKTIENSFVGKKLSYIGMNTLDIYIYHYFIKHILSLTIFGSWVCDQRYYVLVIILSLVLAVLISYISVFIGKMVCYVPVLRNVVYGKKF